MRVIGQCFSRLMPLVYLLIIGSSCAGLRVQEQESLQLLVNQAEKTRSNVNHRLAQNPEASLAESLKVLDEVLDYVEQVRAEVLPFDPSKIQEYTERIAIINENIQRFKGLTLQTDVSFPLGTFKISALSDKGRAACHHLADQVVVMAENINQRYPKRLLRITMKTVGYTDEAPVVSQPLMAIIRDRMPQKPLNDADRRYQYNLVLSQLRSESISHYIIGRLRDRMPSQITVNYIEKIVGKGTSLPRYGVVPPYDVNDDRRRICIIYPYIEIVP